MHKHNANKNSFQKKKKLIFEKINNKIGNHCINKTQKNIQNKNKNIIQIARI
jgi:hypothetical protein